MPALPDPDPLPDDPHVHRYLERLRRLRPDERRRRRERVKVVRCRLRSDPRDAARKRRSVARFLAKGYRVRCELLLRPREGAPRDEELLGWCEALARDLRGLPWRARGPEERRRGLWVLELVLHPGGAG